MSNYNDEQRLTHLDADGKATMVNVAAKDDTERIAVAEGFVYMRAETFDAIHEGIVQKGDVLTVARIAGIMGAKQTSNLIPLCHPIPLHHIEIELNMNRAQQTIQIIAKTRTIGKTGVEMEALTAVSVAALTIYDMAKAMDRSMRINGIRLIEKIGGKSGHYQAK